MSKRIKMKTLQYNQVKITVKGLYDQTFLAMVDFILTNKFQPKRSFSIHFLPTDRIENKCAGDYSVRENLIRIAATDFYSCVLGTVAHELRHVEQDHYGFMNSRKTNAKDEKDAIKHQNVWRREFIEHQKQLGLYKELPILYKLEPK